MEEWFNFYIFWFNNYGLVRNFILFLVKSKNVKYDGWIVCEIFVIGLFYRIVYNIIYCKL